MTKRPHILICEDDPLAREHLQELLSGHGFEVTMAWDGRQGLDLLSDRHDLVLTDLRMPHVDGIGLLRALRERTTRPPVIVMSAYATIESAVEATKEGAYGYLVKPLRRDPLLHLLRQALGEQRLQRENDLLRKELEQRYSFHDLIGKSPRMRDLFDLLSRLADSESTILIQGESGTGKELVSRAIHAMSPRRAKPFVAVNCGGVPESLLESELFGHVRGAFTGAIADKKGLLQQATGGTLLLDEVGETPPSMQVKLLRALEDGETRPVGGTHPVQVNLRVIAATNRDLEAAVRAGAFRADLYYRLNVIAIRIPRLRDRMEDVPLLADHFVAKYSARLKKPVREISPKALACLLDYHWPGNVRELENSIERAVVLTQGHVLLPDALPPQIRPSDNQAQIDGGETLEGVVRRAIVKALLQAKGNRRLASQLLGIPERTLYRRLKTYNLPDNC
jgi:DNA-binding NtrC family response regulator